MVLVKRKYNNICKRSEISVPNLRTLQRQPGIPRPLASVADFVSMYLYPMLNVYQANQKFSAHPAERQSYRVSQIVLRLLCQRPQAHSVSQGVTRPRLCKRINKSLY